MIWDYHVSPAGEHRGSVETCQLCQVPPRLEAECNRCHMPAVLIDGKWQHAEAADAAFCQLVMTRQAVTDADS